MTSLFSEVSAWISGGGDGERGQTTDPTALVPGDPGAITSTAQSLITIGTGMVEAGDGMAKLRSDEAWTGAAADAFRAAVAPYPAAWRRGQGLVDAGHALHPYADVIRRAQSQAAQAIHDYAAALAQSQRAADAYNQQVRAYNAQAAAASTGGPVPMALAAFVDPGAAGRTAAQHLLNDARHTVDTAAAQLHGTLAAAVAELPEQPDWWQRLAGDTLDSEQGFVGFLSGAADGLVTAATGMLNTIRTVNPYDKWNLTHPGQYLGHLTSLMGYLGDVISAPWVPANLPKAGQFAEDLVDWNDWTSGHPGRATGELGFNALLGMAGGAGAGAAAADAATGGLAGLARGALRAAGRTAARDGADAGGTALAGDTARTATTATGRLGTAGHDFHPSWPPAGAGLRDSVAGDGGVFGHPDLPGTVHTPLPPSPQGGLAAAVADGIAGDGGRLAEAEQHLRALENLGGGAAPTVPHADIPPGRAPDLAPAVGGGGSPGASRPHLDQGSAAPGHTPTHTSASAAGPRHPMPTPHAPTPAAPAPHTPPIMHGPYDTGRPNLPAPARPASVTTDYLNQVLTHHQTLSDLGLGGHIDYPGLRVPRFQPGFLPDGFSPSTAVPQGALDAVITPVNLSQVHLVQPEDGAEVWRNDPQWLDTDHALYRLDPHDPRAVWNNGGFVPANPDNLSVSSALSGGGPNSGFVSTSYSPELEVQRAFLPNTAIRLPDGTYEATQYLYRVYAPSGIDVDVSFANQGVSGTGEGLVLHPGGLDTSFIRDATPVITRFNAQHDLIDWEILPQQPNPGFLYDGLIGGE